MKREIKKKMTKRKEEIQMNYEKRQRKDEGRRSKSGLEKKGNLGEALHVQ
jgi:hypothetical protein